MGNEEGWREKYGKVLGGRRVVVVDLEKCLEEEKERKEKEEEKEGLSKYGNSPASPVAYILFTSGTTGTPKVPRELFFFWFSLYFI